MKSYTLVPAGNHAEKAVDSVAERRESMAPKRLNQPGQWDSFYGLLALLTPFELSLVARRTTDAQLRILLEDEVFLRRKAAPRTLQDSARDRLKESQ